MKVEEQLALILSKLDEQSKGISEGNRRLHDVHASVEDLKAAKDDFDRWRSKVDDQVADLRDCVDTLRQQLEALQTSPATLVPTLSDPGVDPVKVLSRAQLGESSSNAALVREPYLAWLRAGSLIRIGSELD